MKARRFAWVALLGVAGLGAVGCSQSYAEGMRVMCETPITAKARIEAAKDPAAKATAAAIWISDHVKNEEARRVFSEHRVAPGPAPRAGRGRERR